MTNFRYASRGSLFQPTLPVRGATVDGFTDYIQRKDFNPRSPCGERPSRQGNRLPRPAISTHAPRAGSDGPLMFCVFCHYYFNPRSPCGERLAALRLVAVTPVFQPTLPVRGATVRCPPIRSMAGYFNPRSPCGERPPSGPMTTATRPISTHAPRAGSDSKH